MMILRTRKEQYLNEIVGNGNTAPGTPYTREELFFADILGEVNAPAPVTRIEIYLAKIANKYSGELPEPVTRIERFIARAAGMDVTIPTPITREEMLWANYALITERELNGIPPLTFNAVAGSLKNYRIYGNTENGESVGNKTANLFDMSDFNPNNVTVNDDGSFYIGWDSTKWAFSCKVETGKTYFISWEELNETQNNSWLSIAAKAGYHIGFSYPCYITTLKNSPPNVWYKRSSGFTATDDYLSIDGMGAYIRNIMLVEGSTAMNYEPYGFKIPVTITADSAETTDIYLDAPLAKSGDIADYIDYATQKRHNSDGTESSVTLPEIAVAVGTNTLTVGTEVQPSNVYIKYEGAR